MPKKKPAKNKGGRPPTKDSTFRARSIKVLDSDWAEWGAKAKRLGFPSRAAMIHDLVKNA